MTGQEMQMLRVAWGWSLAQLAVFLHCPPGHLRRLERGVAALPAPLAERLTAEEVRRIMALR